MRRILLCEFSSGETKLSHSGVALMIGVSVDELLESGIRRLGRTACLMSGNAAEPNAPSTPATPPVRPPRQSIWPTWLLGIGAPESTSTRRLAGCGRSLTMTRGGRA